MSLRNKMTIFGLMSLLLITSLTVAAQQNAEFEISNPQFVSRFNKNLYLKSGNSTTSNRAPAEGGTYQEVSALFRNTGSKSIKNVVWEFVIYKDSAKTKSDRVYTAKSSFVISPGETVRLSKVGHLFEDTDYQEAKVVRIEYEDGTVWNGTRTKR